MSSKTIGLRLDTDEYEEHKEIITKNKKLIIKSMGVLRHPTEKGKVIDIFTLFPFNLVQTLFENYPETRLTELIKEIAKCYDRYETIDDLSQVFINWCSVMNHTKTGPYFNFTMNPLRECMEVNFTHNAGINSNTFSQVHYLALSESHFAKEYNFEATSLNVTNMSFTIRKVETQQTFFKL